MSGLPPRFNAIQRMAVPGATDVSVNLPSVRAASTCGVRDARPALSSTALTAA